MQAANLFSFPPISLGVKPRSGCPGRPSHKAISRAPGYLQCAPSRRQSCKCAAKFPSSRNALDTTLAWGDVVTLSATEVVSDRVPLSQIGMLMSVLIVSWVAVATAKGDYLVKPNTSNGLLFGQHQWQMLLAVANSATTWALFAPVVLAAYASLVSHHWMPSETFRTISNGNYPEMPAQMEVIVAALWTVASWRGIYSALRLYI